MREIKVLYVEDEDEIRNLFYDYFHKKNIEGFQLKIELAKTFKEGKEMLKKSCYNLIVLDLCDDNLGQDDRSGKHILTFIQSCFFTPVIFYTGHADSDVIQMQSNVVRYVNKGTDDVEKLEKEIEEIVKSRLVLVSEVIKEHVKTELVSYFWEVIHPKKNLFADNKSNYSLSYLFLRRIANSLTGDLIKKLLMVSSSSETIHETEYYIYPTDLETEYTFGEILEKEDKYYVILTPSCDFQLRGNNRRKVDYIVLNEALELSKFTEYNEYIKKGSKRTKSELKKILNNNIPRYHYLPQTEFLPNLILDFQIKIIIKYSELEEYVRCAILDSPYSESIMTRHISYYNRVGTPDLNIDDIISKLK